MYPKYFNDAVKFSDILHRLVKYLTEKSPADKNFYISTCYVTRDSSDREIYGTEFKLGFMNTGIVLFDDQILTSTCSRYELCSSPVFSSDRVVFYKEAMTRRGYFYGREDEDHTVLHLEEYTEEMLFQLSLVHDDVYLFNDILTSALHHAKVKFSTVYTLPAVQAMLPVIPDLFNSDDLEVLKSIYQYCTLGDHS